MANNDEIMTVLEVCDYLGVCKGTFYKWIKMGEAPKMSKIGRRVFIKKSDILSWLKQKEKK